MTGRRPGSDVMPLVLCARSPSMVGLWFFFFFQAEDGIRDLIVTGVQTCALPICWIAARYVPWRDEGGAIGGVIGFHTVVTERHRRGMVVRALESIGQSLTSSLDLKDRKSVV